jgi:glycosyltransferase involved in cell wall biosynthesis
MLSRPIRIVHVITNLEPGGAETMLSRLVTHSACQELMTHEVASLLGEGTLGAAMHASGVPVHDLGLRGAASLPGAVFRLARIVRRARADAVMSWLYHADLVGTLAHALTPRTPLIWNIRCADMDLSRYGRLTQTLPGILGRLSRVPAAVVANSEAGVRVHRAYGYRPNRWTVLPNGFDTQRFRPDPGARIAVRRELGIPQGAPLVGLIARFDPMKDHATFFAAAAKLVERVPAAWFLAVGRGVEGVECSQLAAAYPQLKGRLLRVGERSDVPSVMAALDLCVSSSITEGFSNVIGEAMACGAPCVVTEVGDSAAIVGETGRVVPPRDPEALAAQAATLLQQPPEEMEALRQACRSRIESLFSMASVARRYAELFETVATSTRLRRKSDGEASA